MANRSIAIYEMEQLLEETKDAISFMPSVLNKKLGRVNIDKLIWTIGATYLLGVSNDISSSFSQSIQAMYIPLLYNIDFLMESRKPKIFREAANVYKFLAKELESRGNILEALTTRYSEGSVRVSYIIP